MDPATVILVLSTHLICSGGLFIVLARQLPPRWGAGLMGLSGLLFGASFVSRLVAGLNAPPQWVRLSDICMIAAILLSAAGLRQFLGLNALTRRTGALLLSGFVVLQTGAMFASGEVGRLAVVNICLGLTQLWIAAIAANARRSADHRLRLPLLVLTIINTSQGLAATLRGLHIAVAGSEVIYRGLAAQLYYAFSSLATLMIALILLWLLFSRLNGQLAELATRDALTRLLNRTGLDEALTRHFQARRAQPLTLLALDVDHFKRINDTLGHASGDLVLRAVAGALGHGVRPTDIVARHGGEEFLICCPDVDEATALSLAERLRSAVAALTTSAADGHSVAQCTISIGVSQAFTTLADWPRAAADADRALYAAKAAGRDRVVIA